MARQVKARYLGKYDRAAVRLPDNHAEIFGRHALPERAWINRYSKGRYKSDCHERGLYKIIEDQTNKPLSSLFESGIGNVMLIKVLVGRENLVRSPVAGVPQ